MSKVIHLKDQKGKSFTVTPHAFENVIKKDKNWRAKYDVVGNDEEENFATKSESAIPYGSKKDVPTSEVKKEILPLGTKEAKTSEVFTGKTEEEENEFHNLTNTTNEESQQAQKPGSNAKGGSKKSGNKNTGK